MAPSGFLVSCRLLSLADQILSALRVDESFYPTMLQPVESRNVHVDSNPRISEAKEIVDLAVSFQAEMAGVKFNTSTIKQAGDRQGHR